jgi:biopolymer transport protein ExbB
MDTFAEMNNVTGYATPAQVAKGVYMSLITSALGLVVAIPSYLFYAFLAAKCRHLMHDLERAGIEIVNILEDNREATTVEEGGAQIVEFRQTETGTRRRGQKG